MNGQHGWVRPRPDGAKARCGGPGICQICAREKVQLENEKKAKMHGMRPPPRLQSVTDWHQICPPEMMNLQMVWYLYRKLCGLEPKTKMVTIEEARCCFMAGFTECFKIVSDYCGDLTEEKAMELMNRLHDECVFEVDQLKFKKGII